MTTKKSNYWRDRVKKEMDAKEADDISLEQSMKQLHDYHFRNIEKEIESFYQRYADKEKIDLSEARKRASELDISAYQKKAKELVAKAEKLRKEGKTVTRDDFTHQENADMSIYNLAMKTNALELLRLNIDLETQELANGEHKLTKRFLDEGYRKETEFQAGLLGLSVASQASIKSLADAVINANFKGAKWSDNIWDRQDKLRSIISQSVQSAILKGKNGLTIARDIRREFDVSASYAKRLAITEHARVQMEVGRLSMAENGFTMFDIIPEPKACDICKDIAKHGPYHLDKWRTGENSPPFHPYCRCAVVGVDEKNGSDHELLDKLNKTEYNQSMKESSTYARNVLSAVSLIEPRITSQLKHITKQSNGNLQGLDFRLKSLESLSRKISTDSLLDEISLEEAANNINDALRYTAVFKPDNFFDDYHSMKSALVKNGFKIEKVKNTWLDDGPYNGVNTVVSKDNIKFEIQYHTQESFDLKNGKLHELYEERRLPNITRKRKVELDKMMFELSKSLTKPSQIERVN
ncbi:minor capsid protein [Streptococcus dysgalactiae]|uniref:minor capsid protein n=1 Tax=Streptococcus dysgalactiae TaxID=1334 RepID=UPI0010EC0E9A|nr:minor capsid protein [Streptococcus dysgalactiae]VTS49281.1 phage Mu protein F like protein [Streptococcus dysgalactiae subsp. equisimilis]VTS49785.1 phage Mu protein F like protein [Streptococcus dysgalactiae subsp. equisimilis]